MQIKLSRILSVLLTSVVVLSCQDDWQFSSDNRYVLNFSVDTVKMDTVFTGVASASGQFMVYNWNEAGVRLDAVLAGGAESPFRINLDGQGGTQITDLEIPAGDSLYCFVSVNIPESGSAELFYAFDSIRFIMESGNVQYVRLSAYGQNAVRLKGKRIETDTTLTARLPYIIYDSLYVAEGATFKLEKGTRLYFHSGAVLDVAGRLVAQGTTDSMIVMRGDRLDLMLPELPYDLLAGQWGGIRFRSSSYGNELTGCDIHGGNWGVIADSSDLSNVKVSISSSIIHNVNGNCIEATGCRIEVANSQITNAGKSCVDIAGGLSDFTFCTIAAFSLWNIADQAVMLTDRRGDIIVPFEGASFRNCIITGYHTSEFTVNVADSIRNSVPYSISNSLLMVSDTSDTRFNNVVFEKNSEKAYGPSNFVDRTIRKYSSVFALDSLSRARGIADTLSVVWPVDLNGTPRPLAGADAGCFQYKPPVN